MIQEWLRSKSECFDDSYHEREESCFIVRFVSRIAQYLLPSHFYLLLCYFSIYFTIVFHFILLYYYVNIAPILMVFVCANWDELFIISFFNAFLVIFSINYLACIIFKKVVVPLLAIALAFSGLAARSYFPRLIMFLLLFIKHQNENGKTNHLWSFCTSLVHIFGA